MPHQTSERTAREAAHLTAASSTQKDAARGRMVHRLAFGGLLVRKPRWTLTVAGKLLLLLTLVGVFASFLWGAYPFLAVTSRAPGQILVVEGWMPAYMVEQVAAEFRVTPYERVLVARGLYAGRNPYESGEFTAKYISENLIQLGIPQERVQTVFFQAVRRDRTYASAMAVRKWLENQRMTVKSLNVVTFGPHARRSRLLYEKAFGNGLKVGVVALDDQDYDPEHWWRSSAGVKEVPFEFVAYLYVRFLFSPN